MNWLGRLLNKIFTNLHQFCIWFFIGMLFILIIGFSAQYIGNKLSHILLSHKSIKMFIVMDDNKEDNKELQEFVYRINHTYNLKQYHIKTQKIDKKTNNNFGKEVAVVITKNKDVMEELIANNKLSILDRSIFKDNQYYATYSQYDEYVNLETNFNHLKVYVGYLNAETNADKIKVISVLNGLSSIIFRHNPEYPNEESWFEKKEKKTQT